MRQTLYDEKVRRKAVTHLKRSDPAMAGVIARVGPCRFAPRAEGTHFDALVRAIVYQQLSGKAAATIHGRLNGLYGGRAPRPAEVLDTPDEDLRGVGLSRQKLGYLKDLAEHVDTGALPLDAVEELDDDAVMEALVAVKGVGRWTAQMFLMFRLGRPDVFPELDLGIQKAVQRMQGLDALPPPKRTAEAGEAWRPYRTLAAWYLWRSLE
jgi:3-methyladenine DNA glycosylase/8-oxoguanine DNA glycosylase